MSAFDDEAWRQIPPEVKLEIMSRSHSKGFMTALGFIIIASTCAVALKFVWLMWGAILLSPILFQLSANKSWRSLRPATLLRYLAAKSAARRFAYSAKATDLTLDLIFPAILKKHIDAKDVVGALEAAIDKNKEVEVWVTLFKDTIVMMSERYGGAKLEFAHKIGGQLTLESYSPSGGDYTSDKELYLTTITSGLTPIGEQPIVKKYQLASRYPAALIVFEKEVKKRLSLADSPLVGSVGSSAAVLAEATQETDADDEMFAKQY